MNNHKRIVQEGYNQMAERHEAWSQQVRQSERARYTSLFMERLPEGSQVLELGCGSGIPTTRQLAGKFAVTGIDISEKQIEMARRNVPKAVFQVADMTRLDFAPEAFDGIAAFYSITHVPRDEHAALIQTIYRLLKPGGVFMAAMGKYESDGVEQEWLGVPMYFSHWDGTRNRQMVEKAGFHITIASDETAEEDGAAITFLWIMAEKPVDS